MRKAILWQFARLYKGATEGSTQAEALELIEDAIKLHIADRLERGEALNEEVYTSQIRIAV